MLFGRATLPLGQDSSARFLPWLIAFMVFLACLALASVLIVERTIQRWDRGISGQLTVQVPAAADERLREVHLEAVLSVLTSTPGVRGVSIMSQDEVRALLKPWLGGAELVELPLPILIAVSIDPANAPDLQSLNRRLAETVPGTFADDHQRWFADLLSLASSIELAAIVVMLLVGLAAVITVVFVTRTGLEIHRHVIELVHLMGAQDSYIAREFERHALRLGLRGGIFGYILAAAALAGLGWLAGEAEVALLPDLSLAPLDWALLALLPIAAALTAMWTARVTVLRTLVELS